MTDLDLKVLAEKRDALLLAEMAAWLHMFGKFHPDFLQGNYNLDIDIPQDVEENYPKLYELLTQAWTGDIWKSFNVPELNAESLSIYDLIKHHRKGAQKGLEKMMYDAHGRGSGIEKSLLNRFFPSQGGDVRVASA